MQVSCQPCRPFLFFHRQPGSARQQRWQARQSRIVSSDGSSSDEDNATELEARQGSKGVPTTTAAAAAAAELPGAVAREGSRPASLRLSTWHGEGAGDADSVIAPAPRVRRSRAARRSRRRAQERQGYTPSSGALSATYHAQSSAEGRGRRGMQPQENVQQQQQQQQHEAWGAAARPAAARPAAEQPAAAQATAMDTAADDAPAQSLPGAAEAPSRQRISSNGSGRRRNRFGSDSDSD